MAKVIKCPEEVRAEMRAEREAKRAKAINNSLFAANMPNKSGQMEAASLSYVSGRGMMQRERNDRGDGRKEISARVGLPVVHEDTLSGSNMNILMKRRTIILPQGKLRQDEAFQFVMKFSG